MTYRNKTYFVILLLVSISCFGQVIDTLQLTLTDKYDFRSNFYRYQIEKNPANMFYYRNFSFSEIFSEYHIQNSNKYYEVNKGKGLEGIKVEVESYQILSPQKHIVWGKAFYSKNVIKKVVLNENSDLENIYPYISADSIGGNLNNETYFFEGGYSYKSGKNILGIFGRYKAQQEYRDIDPRPKNLVSDLDIDLGYSRNILPQYTISANMGFKNYTQSNDVKFASLVGKPVLYQMLGLGNYSYLFTGKVFNTSFSGNTYRGGIQFFNSEKKNFFFSANIERFNNKKVEENTNSKLTLSKIKENLYYISLIKLFDPSINYTLGISINGTYKERTGTEFYYIDLGSHMDCIDKKQQYSHKKSDLNLSFLYSRKIVNGSYSISPFTNLINEKEKYVYPYSYQEFSDISWGINLGLNKSFTSGTHFFISSAVSWKESLSSENKLKMTGIHDSFQKQLKDDFEFKSSNYFKTNLQVKVYFKISNLNLFVDQSLQYTFYHQKPNYSQSISLGLVF
ncbi:DUF6850 family outer membrane beta-barrel protein [Apibacter adventoris]|uniref:DUF6850 domain-containing protein n=1 Tax=Apibacter adventoris TaxID=1679466 RepID=A0A2S8AEB9_9FLAO|nr:DUF6850 family outer membrane beta-barrel protein [Apibacter adventoris]PQL93449.1 hypothetical protein C4S77_04710 [Apibacter adventoris]